MKLESSHEEVSRTWFIAMGCLFIKLLPSITGLPDRMVLGRDRLIFFIEFKRSKKEGPRKIQKYIHNILREYGFNVYVCTSLKEAQEAYTKERKLNECRSVNRKTK